MTHRPDRDAAIEHLLRALPATEEPDTSAHCLDADTIAALADGGLTRHELAAATDHAATCARCQSILAAVIRTTPAAVPQRAWWRLPALRWLAPAVATGLALAVWIAVDSRYPRVTSVSLPVPTSPPAAVEGPAKEESGGTAASAAQTPPSVDSIANAAPVEAARALRQQRPRPNALFERRDEAAGAAATGAPLEQQAAGGRAVTPDAPAPPVAAAPAQSGQAQAEPPQAAPAPPPAAPLAKAAAAARAPGVLAPAGVIGEPQPAADATLSDRARQAESFTTAIHIASSDPRVRWRIIGAAVERSSDGGVTWLAQTTGTTTRLTAGSAPQPEVCWIVGDDGTVVVSVDGLSWQRLVFPLRTGLMAVTATGPDAAAVTTSDGRQFATTDRGRTWLPR